MNTIPLSQIQRMTDDELLTVEPEMVNEAERLEALRLLLDRLDSAVFDLKRSKEGAEGLAISLDREEMLNFVLEDQIEKLKEEVDELKEALENAK